MRLKDLARVALDFAASTLVETGGALQRTAEKLVEEPPPSRLPATPSAAFVPIIPSMISRHAPRWAVYVTDAQVNRLTNSVRVVGRARGSVTSGKCVLRSRTGEIEEHLEVTNVWKKGDDVHLTLRSVSRITFGSIIEAAP